MTRIRSIYVRLSKSSVGFGLPDIGWVANFDDRIRVAAGAATDRDACRRNPMPPNSIDLGKIIIPVIVDKDKRILDGMTGGPVNDLSHVDARRR